MSYEKFAKTYDELMHKPLYEQWYQFVNNYVPKGSAILELASGTGDLAHLLSQTYAIHASDLSEDMLVISQEKYPTIPVMQLDMCDFELDTRYDAVICFADSICYLPDESSVKRAFNTAYQHLKENGVYLFDVHSLYKVSVVYDNYEYQYVDENTVFTWQSFPGEFEHSVEHDLTCCQATPSGLYERYDETHYQRTYPLEDYQQWLQQAGFKEIEIVADFGDNEVSEKTERWFFVCRK